MYPSAHMQYYVLVIFDSQSGTNFGMDRLEFTVGTENNDKEFTNLRKILVCFDGKMSTISSERETLFPFQVGKEKKTGRTSLHHCQVPILCFLAGRFG